ncbi:CRISPR-associated endonuclease Cas1 [Stieleria varia]|uniref:CRISPR-associated endonuclease Cas1 n=1 Tax=Stieleria varia TaxID=2528005 RepID=A0A5C6AUQ9_9BACT|nr:CRISPR-associated endonuclease Cas1 [Stieleria varia]TWU02796.1 CRISPR-associated endonuclease Cas1 [Stieleria varia]
MSVQLVINTRGSLLRRKGERFAISVAEKTHEFAATKVSSIVIATSVRLTSNVIELATQHNVDIVFFDSRGDPSARIWQPMMGSTVAIRRRQLESLDGELSCEVVKAWIKKKLQNQMEFLDDLSRRRPKSQIAMEAKSQVIRQSVQSLSELKAPIQDCRESLMGIEGNAGRAYFEALSSIMPSEYRFRGRSRRPAIDGFNAMLNYTYGVLYSSVERACILAGLDPHIGFLHTDNYNKPSLVFDMIEPFRIIGDRVTTYFFTGRRVKSEYFREVPGGVELAPEGRASVIARLNEHLDRSVRYPVQRTKSPGVKKFRKIKLRSTIQHEAHALANRLLGRDDMPRIVESENIFQEEDTP